MKDRIVVYPIVISYEEDGTDVPYLVAIPALDGMTQGKSVADSIQMARDFIGLKAITLLADDEELPEMPKKLPTTTNKDDIVTLVDVNVDEYRRKHDNRVIKKTLTIPNYLNEAGIEAGINFSQVLAESLKEKLEA
ncbi:type II toxin-antitoxin system HicB family antitoxin [Lactiplantibacillus sp. WILCCON 0030]|uniref:Type II toxin-antitoxin system HicB family antitoxin n=1 Tax=Lactiplantibacillus brownii TaxID=3069269 RepID=A0ABU1AEC7_9LACO|nr:type II toxin-antitoxin system HicB family antitoxin [Lactiplantibacillus brownii]MDQ7938628.1 type II toxin-antitoxin system HicB family antitoxin [Lactiplantibacillus brownii]